MSAEEDVLVAPGISGIQQIRGGRGRSVGMRRGVRKGLRVLGRSGEKGRGGKRCQGGSITDTSSSSEEEEEEGYIHIGRS